ncbi:ABC transporter substrate-binding protein [Corynebacterium casei]|uniref:ABC transporter substrate-binding protein n=1 Tax=Corynebacterium casei TaxID=160386 RepID=UPI003F91A17D
MKKNLLVGVSLALAAALTTACGNVGIDNSADASSDAETVTITDQRGVEVTVDQPVNSVASAVIPAPALLAAVDGSWDRIDGINQSLADANERGIMYNVYPEAKDTPIVSDSSFVPNMETVIDIDPDVFIQWGDRGDDVVAPIESAGISMLGLENGTQEDLETTISMFGEVLGQEERADHMLSEMDAEAEEITKQVKAIGEPAQRAALLTYASDGMSISTGTHYTQHIFDLIGLENIGADSNIKDGNVSAEQLIAADPEILFLSAFSDTTPEDIYNDPQLKDLTAVKEKRVYRTPIGMYRWQVPCAESSLFWHWAAQLAYPDSYEVDLKAKTEELISYDYGYEITDEDYEKIMAVDINSDSADFDVVM